SRSRPAALRVPLWVTAPAACTDRLPDASRDPRSRPLASARVTLRADVTRTRLKSFAGLPRVTSPEAAAMKVAVVPAPLAVRGPLWVMAPPAVTVRLPPTVEAPRSRELTSRTVALLAEAMATVVKSLPELARMTSWAAPAAKVAALPAPLTVRAPLWVMVPAAVTVRLPAVVEAPKLMPLPSRRATLRAEATTTVAKSLPGLVRVKSLAV